VEELVVRTAVEELEINADSHTHTRMRLGPGVCAGIEEDTAAILVEDGVVLLEYGSEADVVDDDEALAAAVVVEVLDPTAPAVLLEVIGFAVLLDETANSPVVLLLPMTPSGREVLDGVDVCVDDSTVLATICSSTQVHTQFDVSLVVGLGVVDQNEEGGMEEDSAANDVRDGVVLLEYGSEADVVDDDEALAAAVVVEVLDPTAPVVLLEVISSAVLLDDTAFSPVVLVLPMTSTAPELLVGVEVKRDSKVLDAVLASTQVHTQFEVSLSSAKPGLKAERRHKVTSITRELIIPISPQSRTRPLICFRASDII
jgi:hypothetical protein